MKYEAELFRDGLESTRCFWLTTIGMYNAPEQKSCGFQCGTCVKVFVGFGFSVLLYVKWDTAYSTEYFGIIIYCCKVFQMICIGWMMISKFVTVTRYYYLEHWD